MKDYKKVLEIIKNDSKESGIDIIELLNDLVYNMELADSLDMSLNDMKNITNKIEYDIKNI